MKAPDLEVDLGQNPGNPPGSPSSQPHPAQPVPKRQSRRPGLLCQARGGYRFPRWGGRLSWLLFSPSPGKAGRPGLAAARLNPRSAGAERQAGHYSREEDRVCTGVHFWRRASEAAEGPPREQAGLASPSRRTGPAPFADPGEGGKQRHKRAALRLGE